MGNWAGIVRVSHMGDRKAGASDFHAERDQVEAITGAVPAGDVLELLPAELDVSGGLPLEQRPSLRCAVEGVESGVYAGIIVAYQSRLGRDTEYEETVWRRVEQAGGRILLALDGIDTTTVDGKMIRRIRAAMNTAERERHVVNFDRLRKWSTENGIWQARQTPAGYSRDPETKRLIPDERADDVRAAFRARAAGEPLVNIAARMRMTPSGVRQMLRNDVYLGILTVGQYVNPTAHEALVDRDTFEAAQRAVARPPRTMDGPALLAGLVRCASCGHVMSRKKTASVVYACAKLHSGEHCPAPASITTALVDAYVEKIALAELARLAVTASGGRGVERARNALTDAERELQAYVEAVSAADLGVAVFAAGARKRSDAVEAAQNELRAELGRADVVTTSSNGAEVWGSLDAHERNVLLRGLLEAVVVAPAGGRGVRVPIEQRVRVVAVGAGLQLPRRGGSDAAGIRPLVLDADDPRVLRVSGGEDRA